MNERVRVLVVILIMVALTLMVTGSTIWLLYRAAFEEQLERLVETAHSQARLIEAIARYDAVHSTEYPGGAKAATLSQIAEAHKEYGGTSETVLLPCTPSLTPTAITLKAVLSNGLFVDVLFFNPMAWINSSFSTSQSTRLTTSRSIALSE